MNDNIYLTTPFENDDFFNMILFNENGRRFQSLIDYEQNPPGYDRSDKLYELIINNISLCSKNFAKNYDELKNDVRFRKIIDVIIERWNLNKLSFESACKIFDKNEDYFENYFFHWRSGWIYFDSKKTNPALKEKINTSSIKERLYISIDLDKVDEFAKEFEEKLNEYNLPYCFKIHSGSRLRGGDSICIYTDSRERTLQYLDVLLPLVNNEKYINSIHKPQPHLGIINDLIGFGIEFGTGESYSEIMENVNYKALYQACMQIYEYNKIGKVKHERLNIEYENGNLIPYILRKARTQPYVFQLLKGEYITKFREIIKRDYPDFDIDMIQLKEDLKTKTKNK